MIFPNGTSLGLKIRYVSCVHMVTKIQDSYLLFPQDNTYVTDNAYVCLTVCLTGNEELFQ